MVSSQPLRAASAALLALSLAPAPLGAVVGAPVAAAWECDGAPSRLELPFQPEIPAGSQRIPVLPERYRRPLSVEELAPPAPAPPQPAAIRLSPVVWPDDGDDEHTWTRFDNELQQFDSGLESTWQPSFEFHGFLKTTASQVHEVRSPAEDLWLRHFTLDDAELNFTAEAGRLRVYVSADGSTDAGSQYLIRTGTAGELQLQDAYVDTRVTNGLDVRAGQFKAPILFSSLMQENELLFVDHTGIATNFLLRTPGVSLHAVNGRLEGWLALQNGAVESSDSLAWTARASLRVAGEGQAPRREGAYDADLGETLYVGASWYDDESVPGGHSLAAEAYYTFESFSLAGELVAPGEGVLGGLTLWNTTASAMLVPERWELALRYEDYQERAGAQVWRMGVNRYLHGPNTKLQFSVSRLGHDNSHLDVTTVDLTLVASF